LGAAVVFLPAFFYVLTHLDNFIVSKPRAVTSEGGVAATVEHGIAWEVFSEERVAELVAQGKPVFVDFTADWCLSCKVNERVAFSSKEVQAKFKELGIVALKADWTLRDEKIARALAKYGRNSIPLYVLYSGGPKPVTQLLPEVLSPGIILEAFSKATRENAVL
jgi:thiol:disulfide interchange protein DsbD